MQPDEPQDTPPQQADEDVPAQAVPTPDVSPDDSAPAETAETPDSAPDDAPSAPEAVPDGDSAAAEAPEDDNPTPEPAPEAEAPPAYPTPVNGLSSDESIVVGAGSEPAGNKSKLPMATGLVVLVALVAVGGFYAFRSPKAGVSPSTGASSQAALLPATTPPAAVSITSSGFNPSTVSIKVGQAVVWTNNDANPHFVTSDDPKPSGSEPDPKSGQAISAGSSYDYVFSKAGTYTYHDDLNPSSGFEGVVVVK